MKIINNSQLENIQEIKNLLNEFCPFAKEKMGFEEYPSSIVFQHDDENASNMLGKTAHYDPQNKAITVYVTSRHPKDIMRSISHELVHHAQNERGEFDRDMEMGEGYAQRDRHLNEMEREAYTEGNMVFREWEDGIKTQTLRESFDRRNRRLYERLIKRLFR
tara:strand:- start:52 stop:537 length:486 start_codon:yes stop_codon:yes gene_type:complete